MTYIKIDSNFVEIGMLSRLLELSREQIEKVIDLGYAGPSSQDLDPSTNDINDLVSKIRLGSYLVSLEMPDEVTLDIYRTFLTGSQYHEKIDRYYNNGLIGEHEYSMLSSWV